jgi:hypothetical protein
MAQNLVHFLCVMGSVAEAQQRHGIAIGMDGQCIQVQTIAACLNNAYKYTYEKMEICVHVCPSLYVPRCCCSGTVVRRTAG